MKTKLILLPILFFTFISSCSSGNTTTSSTTKEVKKDFDEDNIILTAPVISDEHVGYSDATVNNKERLDYTLKTFKEICPNGVDVIISAGDQTQSGTETDVKSFMETYKQNYDLSKTPFFFAHGNHDSYWTNCLSLPDLYTAYGEDVYQFDLDKVNAQLGNRHAVVNGIHMLSLQVKTFMPNQNDFTDQTVNWFHSTMETINQESSNMPVIVVCHSPALNTVYGSLESESTGTWGASRQLNEMLKNYPNVIFISGHTHYGIVSDRNIVQTTCTMINAGSTCDVCLDSNFENVTQLPNERQYGYFSIMEIDKNGNVRYTRYDLMKKELIKKPWIIPSPKEDGSHLIKYSVENRIATNIDPVFPDGGTCTYKRSETGSIEINFSEFMTDDMIYHYEVRLYIGSEEDIVDDNDFVLCSKYMVPWYDYPNGQKGIISLVTKIAYPTQFAVKLFACDSFGGSCGMVVKNQ